MKKIKYILLLVLLIIPLSACQNKESEPSGPKREAKFSTQTLDFDLVVSNYQSRNSSPFDGREFYYLDALSSFTNETDYYYTGLPLVMSYIDDGGQVRPETSRIVYLTLAPKQTGYLAFHNGIYAPDNPIKRSDPKEQFFDMSFKPAGWQFSLLTSDNLPAFYKDNIDQKMIDTYIQNAISDTPNYEVAAYANQVTIENQSIGIDAYSAPTHKEREPDLLDQTQQADPRYFGPKTQSVGYQITFKYAPTERTRFNLQGYDPMLIAKKDDLFYIYAKLDNVYSQEKINEDLILDPNNPASLILTNTGSIKLDVDAQINSIDELQIEIVDSCISSTSPLGGIDNYSI